MIRLLTAAGRHSSALISLAILGFVAAIYWPALYAGFVWDDSFFLHDSAWISKGSNWIDVILHGFREWNTYYRPLGIALFAFETRVFDLAPLPMHSISLGMHLANTLMVGVLAKRLLVKFHNDVETSTLVFAAMLIFGLHPALIEPVTWISAQFDMLVTFFTLCGLILNMTLRRRVTCAVAVGLCFFLAACSKEAALSFPLLLIVLDWLCIAGDAQTDAPTKSTASQQFSRLLRRQWHVYVAVLAAGFIYLGFRTWGLGFLVNPSFKFRWDWWTQLQTVCFTYLTYWKVLIWPMSDLAPIHLVAEDTFSGFSPRLLAIDIGALVIILYGLKLFWRRKAIGGLIIGVTAAVLPALHIIPLVFDISIYHERYAMTAIAIACAFLPLFHADFVRLHEHSKWAIRSGALAGTVWLILAMVNIRVTVPLWSNEVRLWEWGLLKNPGSLSAQEFLLVAYIRQNDLGKAQPLAEIMLRGKALSCAGCMLSIASMNITLRDEKRATMALQQAKKDLDTLYPTPRFILSYILLSGALGELKHDAVEAEEAYRAAISYEPLDPEGYMRLAILLAREKKFVEARRVADEALSLYAPDERAQLQKEFDNVIEASLGAPKKAMIPDSH